VGSCSMADLTRGRAPCTAAMRASASRGSRLSKKGCSTCVIEGTRVVLHGCVQQLRKMKLRIFGTREIVSKRTCEIVSTETARCLGGDDHFCGVNDDKERVLMLWERILVCKLRGRQGKK